MKADGSEQTQITNDEYQNWFPHQSPDGKWLIILSYPPEVAELRQDPVDMITSLMQNGTYAASYLIFTRSQQANIEMLGLLPPDTIARVEAGLRQSPKFKEIYANQDAQIFIMTSQAKGTK